MRLLPTRRTEFKVTYFTIPDPHIRVECLPLRLWIGDVIELDYEEEPLPPWTHKGVLPSSLPNLAEPNCDATTYPKGTPENRAQAERTQTRQKDPSPTWRTERQMLGSGCCWLLDSSSILFAPELPIRSSLLRILSLRLFLGSSMAGRQFRLGQT